MTMRVTVLLSREARGASRGPAPLVGEAAPDRRGRRAAVGSVVQLDPHDPLHPLESAPVACGEAQRGAVAVRQLLAADTGREQEVVELVEREAPPIAGVRDHPQVRSRPKRTRLRDQPPERYPAPALPRVEPARAVERRDELVAGIELVEAQLERAFDPAADLEPPVARVQHARLVGYPRGSREVVAGERAALVGAREPPLGAAYLEQLGNGTLNPPRCVGAERERSDRE